MHQHGETSMPATSQAGYSTTPKTAGCLHGLIPETDIDWDSCGWPLRLDSPRRCCG